MGARRFGRTSWVGQGLAWVAVGLLPRGFRGPHLSSPLPAVRGGVWPSGWGSPHCGTNS